MADDSRKDNSSDDDVDFRQILNASFDPVFIVDSHGVIETVNQAAISVFGYESQNELIGQNISVICGVEHAAHHDKYIKNFLETGEAKVIGKQREVPGRKKDGTEFPVELGIREITKQGSDSSSAQRHFVGFVKDLTSIKQHELELEQQQALCQGMIDASFDPMLQINSKGIIQQVNDSACHMFGYDRQEFIGQNVSIICGHDEDDASKDHAAHHDEYIRRFLKTGQRHVIGRKRKVRAKRKDGSEFEIELGVQQVQMKGGDEDPVFCGYIRDLTQQRMDKRTLRKQAAIIQDKFFSKPSDSDKGEK